MRRAAVLGFALLAAVALGCGGSDEKPTPETAPQGVADAFVRELLAGRPDDAAERLSPTHAGGLVLELPQLSIQLQTNHYRVARTKRRSRDAFLYLFKGRRGGRRVTSTWQVTLARDPDAWRVARFRPVRSGSLPDAAP